MTTRNGIRHVFQTYSTWELEKLYTLIESSIEYNYSSSQSPPTQKTSKREAHLSIASDTVHAETLHQNTMAQFKLREMVWKQVLSRVLEKDEKLRPRVATLKVDGGGLNVYRGMVVVPPPPTLVTPLPPSSPRSFVTDEVLSVEEMVAGTSYFSRFHKGAATNSTLSADDSFTGYNGKRGGMVVVSQDISSQIDEIEREIVKYSSIN